MAKLAHTERLALCDTLRETGPEAPTLCGTWTTRDLAAHLVLRETRPDAALGMVLPALRGHLDSVQRSIGERPYDSVVDSVASGPPRFSPFAIPPVDEAVNLTELFIHHEDVRRAGPAPAAPRELSPQVTDAQWSALGRVGRMLLREARTGVVADSPGHGRQTLRKPRDGHGTVVITGAPGEILLYLFGRKEVARVELDGSDADVQSLRDTELGM